MADPDPHRPRHGGLRRLRGALRRAFGSRGVHLAVAAAALGAGFAVPGALPTETPEVGSLAPVYAAPAPRVEEMELRPGETLGTLLNRTSLDPNGQAALLRAFRSEADPRRIRVGTRVTLETEAESGALTALAVEMDPDYAVRLARAGEGWSVRRVETPVRSDTLFVSGKIESILWNAILSHPLLAEMPASDRALVLHRLDQIFQWQIDFSRQIRTGDTYRFVLEREVRPDGSVRSARVVAAELTNRGTAYHALWFDPNGDGDGTYYDLEGRSVRRFFLKKPLEFRRISSRFTSGRYHPILKRWRAHRGVDYAASRGTPIMATGDGVITHRGPKGGLGNAVILRHPNGFLTRYGHMSGFADGLGVGSRVRQGQVIGYVGATGLATGPHLHYEMIRSGKHVDPLAIELPAGDPVPEEEAAAWDAVLAESTRLLNRVPPPTLPRTALGREERGAPPTAEDEGE